MKLHPDSAPIIPLSPANDGLTVGENTYRRLRSDIIFARLKPGQKLKLDALKTAYGASVSTLREILARLSAEGFVLAEGQRGFEVMTVSVAGLRDVAEMRLLLECHAIQHSFASGDVDWEGEVVSAHHKLAQMEKRILAGDQTATELWKRHDGEFHRALISACGSSALMKAHVNVYDHYLRYQMVALVFRGEIARNEHSQLLDCALRRDADTARKILTVHINECVDYALKLGTLG